MAVRPPKLFSLDDVHLILGRRGSGKTTLARKLQEIYPRLVIFDPLEEYPENFGITVRSYEEFSDAIIRLKKDNAERFTIVFKFNLHSADHTPEFNECLSLIYVRGSVMVCIEEVQMLSSVQYLPTWFRNLIFTGRHRQVGLIMTTQRPARCHKDIISQCNHIWVGPLHEKNDIAYVRTVLSSVKDTSILSLPDRRFYHYRPGPNNLRLVSNDLKKNYQTAEKPDSL